MGQHYFLVFAKTHRPNIYFLSTIIILGYTVCFRHTIKLFKTRRDGHPKK
jgi:hypothetical protein